MGRCFNIVLSLSVLTPLSALAVGLGSIEINSNLNQPLKAKIKLSSTEGIPLSQIKVTLADDKAYERAELDRPYVLSQISLKVKRLHGQPYIILSSRERINNPFLQVMVDVTWPKGQFYRAYNLLLDPPGYKAEKVVVNSNELSKSNVKAYVPPSITKPKVALYKAVYGPTVTSDDLWLIAEKYKPSGVSIQRTMMAIFLANPKAFINGNINKLKLGQKLKIPNDLRIQKIDPKKALLEFKRHEQAFKAHKDTVEHVLTSGDMEIEEAIDESVNKPVTLNALQKKPEPIKEKDVVVTQEEAQNFSKESINESQDMETKKEVIIEASVSSNLPEDSKEQSVESQFVEIHPIIDSLITKADEINKSIVGERKEDKRTLLAEERVIAKVNEGNELLKSQINSLKEQNELLKQALITEKASLTKTNAEMKQLNSKLVQYFERNDKGELILKEELSIKDDASSSYYLICLIALLSLIVNICAFILYKKKQTGLFKEEAKENKSETESDKDPSKDSSKPQKESKALECDEQKLEPPTSVTELTDSSSSKRKNEPKVESIEEHVREETIEFSTKEEKAIEENLPVEKPKPDDNNEELIEFDLSSSQEIKEVDEIDKRVELNESKEPSDNAIEFELTLKTDENSQNELNKKDYHEELTLAETYLVMEDYEQAKVSLNKVIENGSEKEQEKAKQMLAQINDKK